MTIRFACELGALAAAWVWGWSRGGIVLAIAAPLVIAMLWGAWIAPRARRRLADPLRFAVESLVWIGSTAALVDLDRPELAIAFGVLAFVSAAAARRYEPRVTTREPNTQ